jgi:subtilase family serine protease
VLLASLCFSLTTPLSAQDIFIGGPQRPGYARPPLHIFLWPAATSAAVPYTPTQIRHAYGFDQLLQSGVTGAGQKIAIVDAYGNQNIQSDLNAFCSQFGLNATTVQVIGSNPGGRGNGWDMETSLDVEWAHVVAPGATIILSVAPNASNSALLAAVDAAVAAGASVVSMSWGGTESSGELSYDYHFNKPNVTFVASSGDGGELTTLPEVEWPAASPNVVGVGGTSLYLDSSGNRIAGPSGPTETAWSDSGGGLSSFYSTPAWQGPQPPPQGSAWNIWSKRGVPDVGYVADPNTGLYVYCSTYSRRGSWFQVGGTSAGAPQWAALIALANQGRGSGVSGNNDIYSTSVAGTPPTINANNFLDISSGSDGSDPDDISVVGYDLVTGLGSPVATGVVPALVAVAPASKDFSVSVTPTSRSVAAGGGTSYTVSVSALGGFSDTVNLTVSGLPGDATSTFNPPSVSGSGSSTLSITAGATTGSFTITVTGTSGSLTHSATATLVVATPGFSISASPTSQSVRHGNSASYTVTVAPVGGFTSTVSLTASVSPVVSSGPTVSFSPQQISGGSGNSTMTVRTSSSTPRRGYTITITGTSGSTGHSTSVSLSVN